MDAVLGDVLKKKDWLFHFLAPFYDHLIRRPQPDRLKILLDLPPNGFLLDLAGGTGRVSFHFAGPNTNILVCDINYSMLKQVKHKKGLLPLQTDAAQLPFPANSFDGILLVDALHHFFKPQNAVSEMLRVLKPGGRLLIEEQDFNRVFIKIVQISEKMVGLHSHFLTDKEISALFHSPRYELHFERGDCFTFRILVYKLS